MVLLGQHWMLDSGDYIEPRMYGEVQRIRTTVLASFVTEYK